MWGNNNVVFSVLVGKTLTRIEINENKTEVRLVCSDGSIYEMSHYQDCCESVWLEDVAGHLPDILNQPILLAEVVTNSDDPPGVPNWDGASQWTFYKMSTNRGSVTLRWCGTSNGYYSVDVDFECVQEPTVPPALVSAKEQAYSTYEDGEIYQFSFKDGSLLQVAKNGAWAAIHNHGHTALIGRNINLEG